MPLALLATAGGLGDILRITPLVRVLAGLGYEVDVLLAPDYPGTAALLEGAPEVRRLYYVSGPASSSTDSRTEGLEETQYEVAVFTYWARRLAARVRAGRTYLFDARRWKSEGDSACAEHIARTLGGRGAMPAPFAVHSGRTFNDLAPGTVALHPGCKAGWPWKKWHGFPELAAELPHVVVVGTEEDRRTEGTYFGRPYEWPPHVRDLTGTLSLPDTAALLSRCAALVSNDSGLMHLGVALGIPVFGVFGITSPAREVIPAPNMLPVTKGLGCEPACRGQPWGRRDCHRHLECLRTLTGREVADRVRATLPQIFASEAAPGGLPPAPKRSRPMTDLSLAYYGYVADHSGYGHTARAYIHALHRAGVHVSVVDLARRRHAPPDPLVASLVGNTSKPDLHLFHGIPPQWARLAFPLKNALGMTVWETDAMPSQWRNALNHVRDVWLPCEFNVETFGKELEAPIFRLPHPVFPPLANGDTPDPGTFLGVEEDEFVFYALFEWQDRKGPHETIDAYLAAFTAADRAVLVLKANAGAAEVAKRAVQEARERRRSDARVELRAEAWSEALIEALHRRGDCYVSLHRGEGWGYPLFEAAARGKPVVATAYSGPLDYLDAGAHGLVRWTPAPVRQRYPFYNPRMRWAEPDTAHASELMRGVFDHREDARARAAAAGARIRDAFSLDAVGAAARARLEEVLTRTAPARRTRAAATNGAAASDGAHARQPAAPAAASAATSWLEGPVPLEWYDQDYFETGRKSNWDRGYSWGAFGGLFRETSAYLLDLLPDAASYLDAGCAKGFLVRALRERGKDAWGVDGSPWAIEHADSSARPFLLRADVAALEPARDFDIVTAFNLLAHLTEEQALAFLARVRPQVGTAILATIPTVEPGREMPGNRDPSHVTRRSRGWWVEVFRRAGWQQDPLHRVVERLCQQHPLPQRMGWEIFLFAPGAHPAGERPGEPAVQG
jgi:glycosyltransferase involved in cell wall biosynthesis/SAM-dependent methyltransferase